MNVNDPIAPRALAASHPDASSSEVDWQAWQLRYADQDAAVLARIGGRLYVQRRWEEWGDPAYRDAAEILAAGRSKMARLPESAFDWPIYLAARPC